MGYASTSCSRFPSADCLLFGLFCITYLISSTCAIVFRGIFSFPGGCYNLLLFGADQLLKLIRDSTLLKRTKLNWCSDKHDIIRALIHILALQIKQDSFCLFILLQRKHIVFSGSILISSSGLVYTPNIYRNIFSMSLDIVESEVFQNQCELCVLMRPQAQNDHRLVIKVYSTIGFLAE